MEVAIEMPSENREFTLSIVGVTHSNDDGSNRQDILAKAKAGEKIKLVREYENEFDKEAVAVFNSRNEQLGYLPKGDRLAHHIDSGGKLTATINKIIGGPSFFQKILKKEGKSYGCVLLIKKGSYDWDVVNPLIEESKSIVNILEKAKKQEASNIDTSVKLYKEAIVKIEAMDSKGRLAASWRRVRHPINRLSLLLEKQKELDAAYQAIAEYEAFNDIFGLLKTDLDSVEKRKLRLEKKLGENS
tara:strand:- start:1450 stop:2181 length:732 start_codon:yes stop_codon:yes gene_type:complete